MTAKEKLLRKSTIIIGLLIIIGGIAISVNLAASGKTQKVALAENTANDVGSLTKGTQVKVSTDNNNKSWTGTVKRIGKTIDEHTQTQTIYISVSGEGLFQGMFLNASLKSNPVADASLINRSLINKDNTVYIVDNNVISTINIEIAGYVNNQVIVKGIPEGTQLLASKFSGIYDGMAVKVVD